MATKKTTDTQLPDPTTTVALTGKVKRSNRARWRRWLFPLLGLVVLACVPLVFDLLFGFGANFELHGITLICIFIIAALAQNILTGYAAQPSLGNAAFFGIGAYMLAWTTNDLNQPYWLGILVAILVSTVLGIIVGGPALRISGAYLAIATLGMVLISGSLLNLWDTTAGRQNYDLLNLPQLLTDDHALYLITLAMVALLLFLAHHLLHSRIGRAWIAIRDNEAAAESFGIPLARYKLLAFVISAAMTGLAGAWYATWATTASSSMSSVDQTVAFLAMIVVGGLGSIPGSILGAIFVGFLPLLLNQLPNTVSAGPIQLQISTLTTGIYGLLLLLALIFFPAGLSNLVEQGQMAIRRLFIRGDRQ